LKIITIEIQYEGEQIAQINKDCGIQLLEIEIFTEYIDKNFSPKFPLSDFLFVLNEAQRLLRDY